MCRRWKHCLVWFGAGCVVMAGLLWWLRAPLLTGVARAWVVNEPVAKADAIVVLGGRPDLRAVEAARLYQQGIAPQVLYMDVKLSPSAELGITLSEREQTRQLLLSNRVPERALTALGNGVASTFDESQAVCAWLKTNQAKSLIIPTELPHTRRVNWLFRKETRGSATQIHVQAIEPKEYGVTNWWKREEGLIGFQNEVVKSVFYWFKF